MTQPQRENSIPEDFRYDVFISYSSHDKAWVRGELLEAIEKVGLKAFIDYRDFTRGAPSISECERGVRECRKTLLILTPDYVKSSWGEMENIMVQTLDPSNRELRLIPLLKLDCEKPLRIGALTHIDFTDGADYDLAWLQLLTALGKQPEPEPPKEPERDAEWFLAHPYPMPPNFTGRIAERAILSGWLDADVAHPLLVVRALGGFGKSALTWHWLTHDVKATEWPRVVWWSFYEGDASFDKFLIDTLDYLSDGKAEPKETSGKNAVRNLLQILRQPGTLIILDGFERALRAFGGLDAAYRGDEESDNQASRSDGSDRDCISPLAEDFLRNLAVLPNLRSKVLLTTRLRPRVLQAKGGGVLAGCDERELKQMQPTDAVEFFRVQGIRGTHTEIEVACEPYGYHPLSLRLLAGLIVGDLQQPGDIAAAKRLDVSGDLVQRQHHVLETAYNSLTVQRQKLLRRIACFRSPMHYDALKAVAETEAASSATRSQHESVSPATKRDESRPRSKTAGELDIDLRDLVSRGLLHHDTKEGRFDLHPIVRRYAYDRLAAPERAAAHTLLRDYFVAVPKPDKVVRLEDLAPVIELYHHTIRAGQVREAWALFRDRIWRTLYYQLGGYLLQIDLLRVLFPEGEGRPDLEDDDQAHAMNELANCYSISGQPRIAVPLFEQINAICKRLDDKPNIAVGLGNIADDQMKIGALRAAENNLRQRVTLCREIKNEPMEAIAYQELGRVLAYRGAYAESDAKSEKALKMFKKSSFLQALGIGLAYRALRALLRLRSFHDSSRVAHTALKSARRSLEMADETARKSYPHEHDYVLGHWLLGATHRIAGHHDEAEGHLNEALERSRRINLVSSEADILIELARLRTDTGAWDDAKRLADEALLISERCGYVLQGADAHLELAKLALAHGHKKTAFHHGTEARRLATCDGPPDFTYKAAYDEAGDLLKQLT